PELSGARDTRRATLDLVLVTHGHRDHAGGAPARARAHPAARFARYPWPGEDADEVPWETLADGQGPSAGGDSIAVLHTPGHSPDHVAFFHADSGTLFTGDLVVLGGSVMIHA